MLILGIIIGLPIGLLIALVVITTLIYFKRPVDKGITHYSQWLGNDKGGIISPISFEKEAQKEVTARNEAKGEGTPIDDVL